MSHYKSVPTQLATILLLWAVTAASLAAPSGDIDREFAVDKLKVMSFFLIKKGGKNQGCKFTSGYFIPPGKHFKCLRLKCF